MLEARQESRSSLFGCSLLYLYCLAQCPAHIKGVGRVSKIKYNKGSINEGKS